MGRGEWKMTFSHSVKSYFVLTESYLLEGSFFLFLFHPKTPRYHYIRVCIIYIYIYVIYMYILITEFYSSG